MSPGPGAYEVNNFVNKDRTPTAGFGKTGRNSIVGKKEKSKLGPGNYDVNPKKGGPSFSFGAKSEQKVKSEVPGPGNYDPNLSAVKDKVKNVSMGKSRKRSDLHGRKSVS